MRPAGFATFQIVKILKSAFEKYGKHTNMRDWSLSVCVWNICKSNLDKYNPSIDYKDMRFAYKTLGLPISVLM